MTEPEKDHTLTFYGSAIAFGIILAISLEPPLAANMMPSMAGDEVPDCGNGE